MVALGQAVLTGAIATLPYTLHVDTALKADGRPKSVPHGVKTKECGIHHDQSSAVEVDVGVAFPLAAFFAWLSSASNCSRSGAWIGATPLPLLRTVPIVRTGETAVGFNCR